MTGSTPQILTAVHLARLLGGWEGGVLGLLHNGSLLAFDVLLLELRQKAIPVFGGKVGVLCKLSLDHQCLDMVDGMNVFDAVLDYPSHLHTGPTRLDGDTARQALSQDSSLCASMCVDVLSEAGWYLLDALV